MGGRVNADSLAQQEPQEGGVGRRHLDVCGGVPGSGDPQCAVSPKCNASCITRAETRHHLGI